MPNRKRLSNGKRLSNDAKLVVLKKENPFGKGTERYKRAATVFASNGKPWAEVRKRGVTSWTLHTLEKLKLVKVA